jgi:outer membrane protein OmpA-like peptidoglycan-associated protein
MDVVALSADGKSMLLAVSDEFDSNIYISRYENNRWNPAVSLGKPINTRYFESHASFSPDGKSIYFSSNRRESMGGMDIFRSDLQEDGSWGDPVNLGPGINTLLNEEAPYLSPDGSRLYFSSQGHSAIGGYDIFFAERLEDGSWYEVPVNLGYPLNTTDDDFPISPTGLAQENSSLIFANSKVSGYELLKFDMIDRDATPETVAMAGPDLCAQLVAAAEGEVMPDQVPADEPEVTPDTEPDVTPEAEVETEPDVEPETEVETEPETEPETEIVTPPEKYLIRPVFFEFDSYELSKSAMNKIDELTKLMERFPALELEITGHTDALGSFEYNQRLSYNRANSVSKYLILNGIPKSRLKVTGMSESEHIARNTTRDNQDAPDGRALNRRAQFKVSITEEVIVEMEKIEVPDHLKLD